MNKYFFRNIIFSLLGGVSLLFIIAPLFGLMINSNTVELSQTIHDGKVWQSIGLTMKVSALATLVFAFSAIPLAYLLARNSFKGKGVVNGIIDLPVVIPHSAAGIALLTVISKQGIFGKPFELLGIDLPGTEFGIALAMAFVSVPFLINAARDGFNEVPVRLEKAALNLGASPFMVFLKISLPLAWRSVVTGLVMMFARGMSEFGAVVIVAYYPMITPVMIFERFGAFGLKYARPLSLLFLVVCLIVFIILRSIAKPKEYVESI
jgi:molybdate/tungstate transport system permease protein